MAAAVHRRNKIGHRRRTDEEAEDEGAHEIAEIDDDSLTEGSIASDEHDLADDSDTSNVDEASPTSPVAHKSVGNGAAKHGIRRQANAVSRDAPRQTTKQVEPTVTDTEIMLNRLSLADKDAAEKEIDFDEVERAQKEEQQQPTTTPQDAAPIVVSSSSATRIQPNVPLQELKRREHEEYRRKRDEDPTFVPNRGNFFLHDHRHAGPAANGFRPFVRGARGRGRGGFMGGLMAPMSQLHNVPDPTMSGQWRHDMHEAVTEPLPHRPPPRYMGADREGPPNGNGAIATAPKSETEINREMSSDKPLGMVTIRVLIPPMTTAKTFPGIPMKQYTKLPDHRPPLRRDKPVRISIPYHNYPLMPRYIFPADDRSFIFIPRALRPNQQRVRGKGPRSVLGSMGGFSRRTSVYGGSYYGSVYSPSIAMSRRSSIAPDVGREFILSPTGSAISRPPIPLPMDNARPVVRLPPLAHAPVVSMPMSTQTNTAERPAPAFESSINDLPQPQTHPLPQKPAFQENRPTNIPMHQPRPQKTVSIENIESPVQQTATAPQPYQQAFHQQVPPLISNGLAQESHVRNPSYQSQLSSATPLSQIPERAIHAAPFQPNTYAAQPGFYAQPYPMMPQPQQGYYYPQAFGPNMQPNTGAPAFVPATQPGQPVPVPYAPTGQPEGAPPAPSMQANGQASTDSQSLVAQEINGMVYYYNASQLGAVTGFPSYPNAQPYTPGVVGMGGMMAPAPENFYYQQPAPGMVYYAQ